MFAMQRCHLGFIIFTEAIVVVLESAFSDIKKVLTEICEVDLNLDFIAIPDGEDLGTADTLRRLSRDRIKVWQKIIYSKT